MENQGKEIIYPTNPAKYEGQIRVIRGDLFEVSISSKNKKKKRTMHPTVESAVAHLRQVSLDRGIHIKNVVTKVDENTYSVELAWLQHRFTDDYDDKNKHMVFSAEDLQAVQDSIIFYDKGYAVVKDHRSLLKFHNAVINPDSKNGLAKHIDGNQLNNKRDNFVFKEQKRRISTKDITFDLNALSHTQLYLDETFKQIREQKETKKAKRVDKLSKDLHELNIPVVTGFTDAFIGVNEVNNGNNDNQNHKPTNQ